MAVLTCDHCVQPILHSAERINNVILCSPKIPGRMDCYALVQEFGHETPCVWCEIMFVAYPTEIHTSE